MALDMSGSQIIYIYNSGNLSAGKSSSAKISLNKSHRNERELVNEGGKFPKKL